MCVKTCVVLRRITWAFIQPNKMETRDKAEGMRLNQCQHLQEVEQRLDASLGDEARICQATSFGR